MRHLVSKWIDPPTRDKKAGLARLLNETETPDFFLLIFPHNENPHTTKMSDTTDWMYSEPPELHCPCVAQVIKVSTSAKDRSFANGQL